jgi:hypothetical protein
VVWDREREEGMRIIQREGMGKEEKGRGRKEGGMRLLGLQTKFLDPPLNSQCTATVPVYLTNVVILKILSTSRMHLLEKGRLIDIFVQNMK